MINFRCWLQSKLKVVGPNRNDGIHKHIQADNVIFAAEEYVKYLMDINMFSMNDNNVIAVSDPTGYVHLTKVLTLLPDIKIEKLP